MNSLVDSGTNALFPSLLAGFLDGASVLNARQVCKTWQDCPPLKNTKDNDDRSVREGYPRIVVNLFRRANHPICNMARGTIKRGSLLGLFDNGLLARRMVESVIRINDRSNERIAIALYVRGRAPLLEVYGPRRSKTKATLIVLHKRAEASSFEIISVQFFRKVSRAASTPVISSRLSGPVISSQLINPNRVIAAILTWPLQTFEEGEIPDPQPRALYQRVLDVFRYLRCSQVQEADVIDLV